MLSPVVVSASRTAETTDTSLAPVSVITLDQIQRLQAQSVQDLLHTLPGVTTSNNGGPGKASSVFLRGAQSDQVLVLINGVKAGSATLGTTALQDIPVDNIERIEVVRGPRSSLYGSEAIGGVIQIFTRKGGGPPQPFFKLGTGSHDTYSSTAGLSGGGEHGWFNISASGMRTSGFNTCRGLSGPGGAGCYADEPDADGYRNLTASLRAGYRFQQGLEIESHALRVEADNEFDGSYVNESESVQQITGGSLRFSPLDTWQIDLSAGQSRDQSDNFLNGEFQTEFETVRESLAIQNDLSIGTSDLLIIGADHQRDIVDGTTDYTRNSRDNTGIFTQYQTTLANQNIQIAWRNDHNEQFGSQDTGSIAWGYQFSNQLRITASVGTAFNAPTFNELYYPGYGNPNLNPEESTSIEAGLSRRTGWGQWSLNAYQTRINNLIAYDASAGAAANIDKARISGLEIELATQLGAWGLNTNATLLNPENQSTDATDGDILPRRAKQSFYLEAYREFGDYRFGSSLLAVAERYDDLSNSRRLGGYTIFDVRFERLVGSNWRLQVRLHNLFDKQYETAASYNQPGRTFYFTLHYQP